MTQYNVSPHVLADVIKCETYGWVRHVQGYTSPSDGLKALVGQAIHAAIAAYLDPAAVCLYSVHSALAKFHEVYDAKYAAFEDVTKLDLSLTPQNLDALLRRWIEMHPPEVLPWRRVIEVETAFVSRTWEIGGNTVQLVVRPDMVVEDNTGKYRFVDTKSTGWRISDPTWQQSLRLSFQMGLYADAVVQRFGDKATYAGWINAIELKKLPTSTRKCPDHGKPCIECGREHMSTAFIEVLTTQERVAQAVTDAHRAAIKFVVLSETKEAADALAQEGAANGSCRWCAAAEWCERGRPAGALRHFLKFDPWKVETGAR